MFHNDGPGAVDLTLKWPHITVFSSNGVGAFPDALCQVSKTKSVFMI
jgi:hypothetical protein